MFEEHVSIRLGFVIEFLNFLLKKIFVDIFIHLYLFLFCCGNLLKNPHIHLLRNVLILK